jgi:type IV pilus assembly protein PilV
MNSHRHRHRPRKHLRPQVGATLIEVLVSVLIFGIGMLGMLGLITAAAKYQSGTEARTQISNAVEFIGERIRANVAAANGVVTLNPVTLAPQTGTGYNYDEDYAAQVSAKVTLPLSPDCSTETCTQVQRATYDMLAWRAQLQSNLPGGAGIVTGNGSTGFDVTVMWYDKTAVRGDDAQFLDTPLPNQECPVNVDPNSAAARFCCPAAANAPDGVRCYNTKIIP